jgi:hypothetical protein
MGKPPGPGSHDGVRAIMGPALVVSTLCVLPGSGMGRVEKPGTRFGHRSAVLAVAGTPDPARRTSREVWIAGKRRTADAIACAGLHRPAS